MHFPTLGDTIDFGSKVVVLCSIMHSNLPPTSMLSDYPQLQKAYAVFVNLVGFVALNGRQKELDRNGGTKPAADKGASSNVS